VAVAKNGHIWSIFSRRFVFHAVSKTGRRYTSRQAATFRMSRGSIEWVEYLKIIGNSVEVFEDFSSVDIDKKTTKKIETTCQRIKALYRAILSGTVYKWTGIGVKWSLGCYKRRYTWYTNKTRTIGNELIIKIEILGNDTVRNKNSTRDIAWVSFSCGKLRIVENTFIRTEKIILLFIHCK